MSFTGKIFGALIGFLLTHTFFGALLGAMIGHYFDKGLQSTVGGFKVHFGVNPQHQRLIQNTFFRITFLVMGHVAKSDGRVSEEELQAARMVMVRLRLDANHTREAMRLFTEGKQPNFDLSAAMRELLSVCRGQQILLQMFYEIQCQAAMANRTIARDKQAILQAIWHYLGLSGQSRASGTYEFQNPNAPNDRKHQAYTTLGLSPGASPQK